jgi:hypothetical protein
MNKPELSMEDKENGIVSDILNHNPDRQALKIKLIRPIKSAKEAMGNLVHDLEEAN